MYRAAPEELDRFLAAYPNITTFQLLLCDSGGVLRGKHLRREEMAALYQHGRALPSSLMGLTLRGEDVEETGLVWEVGDADGIAFPVTGSLRLVPWLTDTAQVQVMLDTERGGFGRHADPRALLMDVIAEFEAEGLYPVMAGELEFYLLEEDANGRVLPARLTNGRRPQDPGVYGIDELEGAMPFLDALYRACDIQGIPARTAISEYGCGQLEITLEHRTCALQAMDETVLYKRLVKAVAAQQGLIACFMAKPFAGMVGNGFHLHASLNDAQGNNVFASEQPDGTPLLRQSIAGLQASLADSMALFCPNANSYRRFQSHSYAPVAPTWGVNNRTVAFRVPLGPPASRHLEHRICGADANPYLAAAAVLAAMHRGIRERLDPGPAVVGNGYANSEGAMSLDWHAALQRLAESKWARSMLGDRFLDIFLAVKQAEYRQFMGEVSQQDYDWYLHRA